MSILCQAWYQVIWHLWNHLKVSAAQLATGGGDASRVTSVRLEFRASKMPVQKGPDGAASPVPSAHWLVQNGKDRMTSPWQASSDPLPHCCYSVAQLCPTLCNPMGFPVLHYLPEFSQTHVHRVGDAIHPTISSSVAPVSSCPQSFWASGSFPLVNF